MLVQRDAQSRKLISNLQSRIDSVDSLSPSMASLHSQNVAQLEDELRSAQESADMFQDRCRSLELELESKKQLVAKMMQAHNQEQLEAKSRPACDPEAA